MPPLVFYDNKIYYTFCRFCKNPLPNIWTDFLPKFMVGCSDDLTFLVITGVFENPIRRGAAAFGLTSSGIVCSMKEGCERLGFNSKLDSSFWLLRT